MSSIDAAAGLTSTDKKEAKRRTSPNVEVVHESIRREGESELQRTTSALAWSGLAAGLSMGFSLVAEGLLHTHLPDAPWRPLITKLGYAVGFLVVILARQQLFTENTLTPIIPLLTRRDRGTLVQVARLWSVVLAANLVGALLFAIAVARLAIFEPEVKSAFAEVSRESLTGGPITFILEGIFAGWLIALMVWMLPAARSARVSIIVIITYLVGLGGMSHVVAGGIEALYLATSGQGSFGEALGYIGPTLLGNVIGGVALTAALNHAQTRTANAAS